LRPAIAGEKPAAVVKREFERPSQFVIEPVERMPRFHGPAPGHNALQPEVVFFVDHDGNAACIVIGDPPVAVNAQEVGACNPPFHQVPLVDGRKG
jgi:hypothetical protein